MNIVRMFRNLFRNDDQYIKSLEEHIERLEESRGKELELFLFELFSPKWHDDSNWKSYYRCQMVTDFAYVCELHGIWNSRIDGESFKEFPSKEKAQEYVEKQFQKKMELLLARTTRKYGQIHEEP